MTGPDNESGSETEVDPEIVDIETSEDAVEALGEIEELDAQDVIDAAIALAESAVEARAKEILDAHTESANAAQQPISSTADERRAEAQQEIEPYNIVEQFIPFHERRPYDAASMVTHYQAAKNALTAGQMSAIIGVNDAVDDWAGDARDAFAKNFLAPLINTSVTNQQALFEELTAAAMGYEAILRAGRVDAVSIADKCTAVLDSIASGEKSAAETQANLSLIGMAISITSAATGGPIGLTFGILSTGVSAAQNASAISDAKFNKPTALDTLDQLLNALANLQVAMDDEEEAIAEALAETQREIDSTIGSDVALTRATILPNEPSTDEIPDLTSGDKPPKNQFHPPR